MGCFQRLRSTLPTLAAAALAFTATPVFSAPAATIGAPLSAAEIVRRSVGVNAADWKAQPTFTHREEDIKFKEGSDGKTSGRQDRTYQVIMLDGTPYNRLVEINHEPLTPAQSREEDTKLQHERAARQAESASQRRQRLAKYQSERGEEKLLMEQMATAFRFHLVGEQQVEGVPCYVLDAQPDPNYHPPVQKARVLLGMKGRLYIEKSGFHWVRVHAEVISPVEFGFFVARVKPGTSFDVEQEQVGNVWLPKRFAQSVNATVLGVYGMRNREEDIYTDYRPLNSSSPSQHLVASSR